MRTLIIVQYVKISCTNDVARPSHKLKVISEISALVKFKVADGSETNSLFCFNTLFVSYF